jgi:hypothetical protein
MLLILGSEVYSKLRRTNMVLVKWMVALLSIGLTCTRTIQFEVNQGEI